MLKSADCPTLASGPGPTFLCPVPGRRRGLSTYQDADQVGHLHTEVLGPQVPTVWAHTCTEAEKRPAGHGPQDFGTDTPVPRGSRHGIRGWAGVEWALTIGGPQLGLQGTQGGARWEVGSQVEFPMAGTVLREGQAGSQVLHPGGGGVMPSRLNPGTRDPLKAHCYWGHSQRQEGHGVGNKGLVRV